ncbi:MAG TPA: hypothetical protein VLF61_00320 [Rhabdochlamydiaceae bacterium]|nr:hypothetical protein [Rhabdochlamydiaceae bacterium]
MAIFHFQQEKKELEREVSYTETFELGQIPEERKKDSWVSSCITRLFFGLLLVADLLWGLYALLLFAVALVGGAATLFRISYFKSLLSKAFLMLRRCLVCALSLFVGFFSPAFGIMVACTYFLMYDKTGIEEVIPSSLQEQFKDVFKPH